MKRLASLSLKALLSLSVVSPLALATDVSTSTQTLSQCKCELDPEKSYMENLAQVLAKGDKKYQLSAIESIHLYLSSESDNNHADFYESRALLIESGIVQALSDFLNASYNYTKVACVIATALAQNGHDGKLALSRDGGTKVLLSRYKNFVRYVKYESDVKLLKETLRLLL